MVDLGSGSSSSGGRDGLDLRSSTFTSCLGLLCLAASLCLVGFNLGLDALLCLDVSELFLTLLFGFLDLLLSNELFLGFLRFLGGLLADFL